MYFGTVGRMNANVDNMTFRVASIMKIADEIDPGKSRT